MGFELCAFIGRYSDLRTWEHRLHVAVACELDGELGLVPVTGKLFQELRARLGEPEASRLDAMRDCRSYPSPSHEAAAARWGLEASRSTITAYVSLGEFGNQSHEEAILWSDGRELFAGVTLAYVLEYFRDKAGIRTDTKPVDLERFRGESAAEKWAAAARLQRQSGT